MVSEKQLHANQQNALKSTGPKTPQGKTRSAGNSLKHGLLAREVVITEGEGAEDQQAFDALLADLLDQFSPIGSLEEILVEKIAVCYWRLGRANRYEVGVLRRKLDTATDDYYRQPYIETDTEIDKQIEKLQELLVGLKRDHTKFSELYTQGASLEEIYGDDEIWERMDETKPYLMSGIHDSSPQGVKQGLNKKGLSDAQIWQVHINICVEKINESQSALEKLNKDKVKNKLRLSALKKSSALPPKVEMDNLLRYETAIERQLYKAITQLERQQRHRAGDYVPAPVQVDLNINDLKTGT